MKRPAPARITSERIVDLEQWRESLGERLDKIDDKVDEIHRLLIGAKAVMWLATKIAGASGAVLGGMTALILIYKFAIGR